MQFFTLRTQNRRLVRHLTKTKFTKQTKQG